MPLKWLPCVLIRAFQTPRCQSLPDVQSTEFFGSFWFSLTKGLLHIGCAERDPPSPVCATHSLMAVAQRCQLEHKRFSWLLPLPKDKDEPLALCSWVSHPGQSVCDLPLVKINEKCKKPMTEHSWLAEGAGFFTPGDGTGSLAERKKGRKGWGRGRRKGGKIGRCDW